MGAPKEVQTPGEFKCELCDLSAPHTHYGRTPQYSTLSSCVVKDPITHDRDKFLIAGSRCSLCSRAVCVGTDCSLFYSKSFCLPCVKENLNAFPLEIKGHMDKRKPQQKSCKKNGYKA
uniref:Cysteine-rich DPF motif domain-containing protein 1 n=1 Tax=Catharus ustulatus TaxID=91951 RepID=A0A8C3TP75_CATUS